MRTRHFFRLALPFTLLALLLGSCLKREPVVPLRATLVVSGSFGDQGFFDGALAGLERAGMDFGLKVEALECQENLNLYGDTLATAAADADVVIVLGYQFFDLIQDSARTNPGVNFIFIDAAVEGLPNLATIDFDEAEGSYLAGALAALATTSSALPRSNPGKVVGFAGGMDIPVIHEFLDGYRAGVRAIDPGISVLVSFAGSFEDKLSAEKIVEAQYADGADIVFIAAGAAGLGGLSVARRLDRYAIGVDIDQRPLDSDHILASMIKDTGSSIYLLLQEIVHGSFSAGVRRLGLSDGALRLDWGSDPSPVPAPIRQAVDRFSLEIVAGTRSANPLQ